MAPLDLQDRRGATVLEHFDDLLWCECGRPKPEARPMCARCEFLDGRTVIETALIDELRGAEGFVPMRNLVASTGYNYRVVYRVLYRLVDRGRVVRHLMEGRENGPVAYALRSDRRAA